MRTFIGVGGPVLRAGRGRACLKLSYQSTDCQPALALHPWLVLVHFIFTSTLWYKFY